MVENQYVGFFVKNLQEAISSMKFRMLFNF